MSATREDDHLIFPQKLSSSDYFCVYDSGDNNVVSLIHINTYSAYTPYDYITDEDMVDTMEDDILEEMEQKKW